jgi:hypothetical protein
VGGSGYIDHHLLAFERSWNATELSGCWELWRPELGLKYEREFRQEFGERVREKFRRGIREEPDTIRGSEKDDDMGARRSELELDDDAQNDRREEPDDESEIKNPLEKSPEACGNTYSPTNTKYAETPQSNPGIPMDGGERLTSGRTYIERTTEQGIAVGGNGEFRGDALYKKDAIYEGGKQYRGGGDETQQQSPIPTIRVARAFNDPRNGGDSELEHRYEKDWTFQEHDEIHTGADAEKGQITAQDSSLPPMPDGSRNDTVERNQDYKFAEILYDQGVEQFRDMYADGVVSSLHMLSQPVSEIHVVQELSTDHPPQKSGNAGYRTSDGSSDQGAPGQLGRDASAFRGQTGGSFSNQLLREERNEDLLEETQATPINDPPREDGTTIQGARHDVEDLRVDDESTMVRSSVDRVCARNIESQGAGGSEANPERIGSGTEGMAGEDRLLDSSVAEVLDWTSGTSLAKGSQAYREHQTQKRREREARQAEFKREVLLRETTEITTILFRGEKFQTSRFASFPSELLW